MGTEISIREKNKLAKKRYVKKKLVNEIIESSLVPGLAAASVPMMIIPLVLNLPVLAFFAVLSPFIGAGIFGAYKYKKFTSTLDIDPDVIEGKVLSSRTVKKNKNLSLSEKQTRILAEQEEKRTRDSLVNLGSLLDPYVTRKASAAINSVYKRTNELLDNGSVDNDLKQEIHLFVQSKLLETMKIFLNTYEMNFSATEKRWIDAEFEKQVLSLKSELDRIDALCLQRRKDIIASQGVYLESSEVKTSSLALNAPGREIIQVVKDKGFNRLWGR